VVEEKVVGLRFDDELAARARVLCVGCVLSSLVAAVSTRRSL
jgi:hypothetical protein